MFCLAADMHQVNTEEATNFSDSIWNICFDSAAGLAVAVCCHGISFC
jgi:phosphoserine phosphatase